LSLEASVEIKVIKSEFIYSVPKLSLMRHLNDELAFVGRSNAGKSSLINAISNKRDLARTSKTPGRTRHAVVYKLVFALDAQEKSITLVDLPGFGFAAMSKEEAKACEALIFSYLKSRPHLRMIILLLDIRRLVDEREQTIVNIAKERGIDLLLVLTKCDKVAGAGRKPIITKMADDLKMNKESIWLHSTHQEKFKHALQKIIYEKF
jgi:GTP-binding protein